MKGSMAGGLKAVFFVLITLLSAATSFLYFVEVFSLGRGLVQDSVVSVLLNGFIGILVLDAAALIWLRVYLQASDNNAARAIAVVGAVIGMVGSALTSLAYLLLVAGDGYSVSPDMRTYTQYALALIIVTHFVLVFLSAYKSTQAQIDERTSSMLAEATEEMLRLTEERFRASIPNLAQANAQQLERMLAGQFANLSVFQRAEQQHTAPHITAEQLSQLLAQTQQPTDAYSRQQVNSGQRFGFPTDGVSLVDMANAQNGGQQSTGSTARPFGPTGSGR